MYVQQNFILNLGINTHYIVVLSQYTIHTNMTEANYIESKTNFTTESYIHKVIWFVFFL